MLERVNERIIERGNLIYSIPPNNKRNRVLAMTLFLLGLLLPFAIIYQEIQVELWTTMSLFEFCNLNLFAILPVFLEYVGILYITLQLIHPEFKIYEYGMTRPVIPIFYHRDGKFIPFLQMESFSLSEDGKKCYIFLKNGRPFAWKMHDPNRNQQIINTLRSLKIPEVK